MKQAWQSKWRRRAARSIRHLEYAVLWPLGLTATLALSAAMVLGLIDELEFEQLALLRSAHVEREVEQLLEQTGDLEIATRSFALSHDPALIEPAKRALPRIDAGLGSLRSLAADSPAVAAALRELEAGIRQRIERAQALQAYTANGGPPRAENLAETRQLQGRCLAAVEEVDARERALRQQSATRSARVRGGLKAVIVLSTLLLGVLGWMWFQARRHLQRTQDNYRSMFARAANGMALVDAGGRIVQANASYAEMLGYAPLELVGKDFTLLKHPDERPHAQAALRTLLDAEQEVLRNERRYLRRDGTAVWVRSTMSRSRDTADGSVRLLVVAEDLTERRRSQQALMGMAASVPKGDSRTFFRTLLVHLLAAIGADGAAIARPDENGRMRTLAAVVDGEPLGDLHYALAGTPCALLTSQDEYIVPDDLGAVCPDAAGLPGLQARAYAGRRLEAADGRPLGVLFAVFREPIADPAGLAAVLRVFAVRAGAELERMDGAACMREQAALLDRAREAIVVLGLDLNVKFWNRGAELMYGIAPQHALGSSVLSRYDEEWAARTALAAVLETGEWRGDSLQRRRDGGVLAVDESWTLVRDDQGAPHSILKVGSDVTEKRAAEEKIRRFAYYDSLTGLPNRRLLMDRLKQIILRNKRHGRHGALLFIDMDNFKRLNDVHGHEAGDEFLRLTAARLRACVRADDTVARFGGDEFVILLEALDAEAQVASRQARAIGASIVDAFRKPVKIGAIEHASTASVGAVLIRGTHDDADALLRQADQAMYVAKHGGRNAVVIADDAAGLDAASTA